MEALNKCEFCYMLIISILNVFHTRQSTKNTIFTLSVPRGWFVHKQHVFFLLNDRAVCILQINTFLYVLIIKYIVKHHIYNKTANWKFV